MLKNISKRSLLLVALDLAAIYAALILAFYLRSGVFALPDSGVPFLSFFIVFPTLFYIFDLYHPFKYFTPGQTVIDVSLSVLIGTMTCAAISYLDRSFILPRLLFVYTTASLLPLVFATRIFYDLLFRSRFLDKKTLVLGTGPLALEIVRVIKETTLSGLEVVGLVHENKRSAGEKKNGVPIVGAAADIISLIDWYGIQLVILALDPKEEISEAGVVADVLKRRVPVTSAIHLFEKLAGDVPYRFFGGHYLLGLMAQVRSRAYLKIKRIVDIVFAAVLLILLGPVFLLTMLIISFSGAGNIFFIQQRIGKDGVPFRLIKFRSMTDGKKGKQKITGFGRLIRRYRIDELPQLVNVLKGEMSLVGPRPEIPYFVARSRAKIPFYDAVFAVKPGLTGWAQVKFRYATSVKDYSTKFRYNLYYLKNISLALDLLIILRTIRVVLLGRGK